MGYWGLGRLLGFELSGLSTVRAVCMYVCVRAPLCVLRDRWPVGRYMGATYGCSSRRTKGPAMGSRACRECASVGSRAALVLAGGR